MVSTHNNIVELVHKYKLREIESLKSMAGLKMLANNPIDMAGQMIPEMANAA
jgi:hypothetical protein